MREFNINIKQLLYIIIVYPFFKTYYFSVLGIMPDVNQFLFISSLVIIGFLYLTRLPWINLNSGMKFIIIYYILILISTILSNSLSSDYLSLLAFSIGFGLLVNYSLQNKNEFLYFLSSVYFLLYIYVVSNLFFMVLYPNGIPSITKYLDFPQYVFGNENSVIKLVLPGLCFAFLYDLIKFKKIRMKSWLLLTLVWLTLVNTWSVTSMLGLLLFTFILLKRVGRKYIFFDYYTMLGFSIGVSVFILFLKYENNILAKILQLFGKDLTFSNRDLLWENTLTSIMISPLWGFGVQDSVALWEYTGNTFGSHNYFLDTTFRGGLVALIFFIAGLVYFGKKLVKQQNNYVTRTLIGTSCAYFVMWISEPFISTEFLMFSILFVLISRIDIVLKYYYEP
jgi:O-antigen ligase